MQTGAEGRDSGRKIPGEITRPTPCERDPALVFVVPVFPIPFGRFGECGSGLGGIRPFMNTAMERGIAGIIQ